VAYACLLATQETEIRRIEVLKDHRNAMWTKDNTFKVEYQKLDITDKSLKFLSKYHDKSKISIV
jgi:hypothetical protein